MFWSAQDLDPVAVGEESVDVLPRCGIFPASRAQQNEGVDFSEISLARHRTGHFAVCERLSHLRISEDSVEQETIEVAAFPRSRKGYKACLTAIDRFTRYAIAVPLKKKKSVSVVNAFLSQWIYKLGVPERVLSDKRSRIHKRYFPAICKDLAFPTPALYAVPSALGQPTATGSRSCVHQSI